MSVPLLLLLALVGPCCASMSPIPTEPHASTRPAQEESTVSTEAPTTVGLLAVITTLSTLTEPVATTTEVTSEAVPEVTTVLQTETNTPDVTTAEPKLPTDDPVTPAAGTEALTELVETVQTNVVEPAEAEVGEEVAVEDDAAEGLGSGQIIGIIIGALLAVVIVIAVVIVVVRRMGKYSP